MTNFSNDSTTTLLWILNPMGGRNKAGVNAVVEKKWRARRECRLDPRRR